MWNKKTTMSEPERVTLYWPQGPFFWKPRVKYAEGGALLNGERHGTWTFWYKNGQKQLHGEYAAGKKTGLWTKWDQNGAKITQGTFLQGKMHGKWVDWYANGQRAQKSFWVYGKRDGTWTQWQLNGDVKKTEKHDHRSEKDRGYSLHTDRETEEIIRSIQRKRLHRNWENLVGKTVARFVKPWQIACWVIFFLASFILINARTPWRSAGLAGIVALFMTSLMVWIYDRKRNE